MRRLLLQGELGIVLVKILPDRLHQHQVVALVGLLERDRFREVQILVDVIEMSCPAALLPVLLDQALNQLEPIFGD